MLLAPVALETSECVNDILGSAFPARQFSSFQTYLEQVNFSLKRHNK